MCFFLNWQKKLRLYHSLVLFTIQSVGKFKHGYASVKHKRTGEVLAQWIERMIVTINKKCYWLYHCERLENVCDDLDAMLAQSVVVAPQVFLWGIFNARCDCRQEDSLNDRLWDELPKKTPYPIDKITIP